MTVVKSGDHVAGGWEGGPQVVEEQWRAVSQEIERERESGDAARRTSAKVKEMGERKEAIGVVGEWDATVG